MYSETSPTLFNDTFLPLDRLPRKYQDGLTTEHLSKIGGFSEVHVTSHEESLVAAEAGRDGYAQSLDSDSDTASEVPELENDEWQDICWPMVWHYYFGIPRR